MICPLPDCKCNVSCPEWEECTDDEKKDRARYPFGAVLAAMGAIIVIGAVIWKMCNFGLYDIEFRNTAIYIISILGFVWIATNTIGRKI
jgi:hypothetical protein